jgi:hypothetical protein
MEVERILCGGTFSTGTVLAQVMGMEMAMVLVLETLGVTIDVW